MVIDMRDKDIRCYHMEYCMLTSVRILVFAFWIFGWAHSAAGATGDIITVAGGGVGDGGMAADARLNIPVGVSMDGLGNLYIADTNNHRIRKVDAETGIITTVAGNGTEGFSGDDGPATEASLKNPFGIFVDIAGNLYIADSNNQRIRKVDASSGIITTVAGDGEFGFTGDGVPATETSLFWPTGIFVDGLGNLYIAEPSGYRIRKVDASSGIITTVAGDGFHDDADWRGRFSGDGGPATEASLFWPTGIFVDGAGNLYVADAFNVRIRKVDVLGIITTVAGNGTSAFSGDGGQATEASFGLTYDVFVDGVGDLYIPDLGNHRIRKVPSRIIELCSFPPYSWTPTPS